MKHGIILAGGTGSRLAPLNSLFNKHMVPVYNKFIIDYPLNRMKEFGVENLTIVLGGNHFEQVVAHVKDGEELGMKVNYLYQAKPIGIAQGINLCKDYVNDEFAVILGDNIFSDPIKIGEGTQVVLHKHYDLNRFGVAGIKDNKIVYIQEKPKDLPELDNYAITGCYVFDERYFSYFKELKMSDRGEYEITDIIRKYNDFGLKYSIYEGMWSDAGTHKSINFVNNYFYREDE